MSTYFKKIKSFIIKCLSIKVMNSLKRGLSEIFSLSDLDGKSHKKLTENDQVSFDQP